MSVNIPPDPNVSTFNNLYWIQGDNALTTAEGDLRYLKFPVAQGTENLQATNVNGVLTANSTATFNGATTFNAAIDMNINNINDINQLVFDNSGVPTTQVTAYTGGVAGAYTNTNMTIDANGRISAISNGTSPASILASNNTFTGTNAFNNVAPITSSATQPASNDSSTAIPTTAWVQTAITAGLPASILGLNNTFTGTNAFNNVAPITSSATQPASNDNSTIIPTTAWVQTAIAAIPAPILQTNTAEHYSTALNNVYPFGTTIGGIPLINFADVGTYASAYGMNYWDAVVFDFVFNLTTSGVNTGTQDAGGVLLANNQCSGTMYVYPTAMTTTFGIVASPYFYLNGGIGAPSTGSSAYYGCPVTAYTPNGRPFWVNGLFNGANISVVMPSNTINDGTNAQLIFQFLPINWNSTTICNWGLSITLRNSGKIPVSKISTQNFNINNI